MPIGYSFLHSAIDDHSRVVYSEIPTDEKQETAAAFCVRANAFYASHGITVLRVMTDNGSCSRSRHYTSDQARAGTYLAWIHEYNHHRPHTGIGGSSPIDLVHHVNGKNT